MHNEHREEKTSNNRYHKELSVTEHDTQIVPPKKNEQKSRTYLTMVALAKYTYTESHTHGLILEGPTRYSVTWTNTTPMIVHGRQNGIGYYNKKMTNALSKHGFASNFRSG